MAYIRLIGVTQRDFFPVLTEVEICGEEEEKWRRGGKSCFIDLGSSHFSLLFSDAASLQVSSHSWRNKSLQWVWMLIAFDFASTAF